MSDAFKWDGGVYIGAEDADPGTTTEIGGIKKCNLAGKIAELDVSNIAETGSKVYIPGNFDGEFKASANCLTGDTNGQTALITAWLAGTVISLRFNVKETGKSNDGWGYYGNVLITNVNVDASEGEDVKIDWTFKITGGITYDPDSA